MSILHYLSNLFHTRDRKVEYTGDPKPEPTILKRDPLKMYTVTAHHKHFPDDVLLCYIRNFPHSDEPGKPMYMLYGRLSPTAKDKILLRLSMPDPVSLLIRHGEAGYQFADRSSGLQRLIDAEMKAGELNSKLANYLKFRPVASPYWASGDDEGKDGLLETGSPVSGLQPGTGGDAGTKPGGGYSPMAG